MAFEVIVKKWGNSLGVVIPAEIANKLGIKPDEAISIEVEKGKNTLKELFGSLKFNKPTKQILKKMRKEFESKWTR